MRYWTGLGGFGLRYIVGFSSVGYWVGGLWVRGGGDGGDDGFGIGFKLNVA